MTVLAHRTGQFCSMGAADNSCEKHVLNDLAQIQRSFVANQGVEFIVLLDRAGKHSDSKAEFCEDFTGTRLYRLGAKSSERLSGGDEFPEITTESEHNQNSGDPATLKKFVRFGKRTYPARNYVLICYSHGNGVSMCPDQTSGGDEIFPAEISEVLTKEESVNLAVLDVCSMAGIEIAYQWRPGNGSFQADVLVAAGSVGGAAPYDDLLPRLRRADSKSTNSLDPATLTARELGALLVEVTDEDRKRPGEFNASRGFVAT